MVALISENLDNGETQDTKVWEPPVDEVMVEPARLGDFVVRFPVVGDKRRGAARCGAVKRRGGSRAKLRFVGCAGSSAG